MLRSRLYVGTIPVAGLLILVCLYSIYTHSKLSRELDASQLGERLAFSETERILLSVSLLERALLLKADGDAELARGVYGRSMVSIGEWLEKGEEEDLRDAGFIDGVQRLAALGYGVFEADIQVDDAELELLVAEIEESGLRALDLESQSEGSAGSAVRFDSRIFLYVVVSAIVASVLLMVYVSYRLSQRILAPIDALVKAASQIGDGPLDSLDFVPSSKDEIGRLETAFLDMAGRIRDYQRLSDKQVALTRRRMEECFSNLPNPVVFLNAQRGLAYRNPAAAELLEKVSWVDALLPQLESRIERVFGTGEEIVETDFEEMIALKVDDRLHYFLPIFVRVDSDDAEEIECGLVLQDITQLRLSDELKSDMVATVSHEIKTPVTSVTMALHLVLEKSLGELTEDQQDVLETANRDLARLRRLLDHFLEIARLERKSPRLHSEFACPLRIVSLVVDAFALSAQGREVRLVSRVEESLPEVVVDVKAIEVGLSNYLSNAIKYSPIGGRVEVYACRSGDRVRFGVRDEGPGLDEEESDRVFEKFYRSHRHRKMEGIGLGLSIVKDIAIAHGGTVGCIRLKPKGSDFFMEIEGSA